MFRHPVSVLSRMRSSLRSLDDSKYIHISSCSFSTVQRKVHNTATRSRKRYFADARWKRNPVILPPSKKTSSPSLPGPYGHALHFKTKPGMYTTVSAWRLVCLPYHYCCCVRRIFQRARRRTRALRQKSSGRVRGEEGKGLRRHTRRRVESQERGLRRRGQHRHREDREDRQERSPKISRTEKS